MCRAPLITITLLLASIACFAQQRDLPFQRPTGGATDMFNTVNGTVSSTDNKPLKDVRVELFDGNGSTLGSAYTTSSGSFEFPQVRPGTYEVVASLGLEQTRERIEVSHMNGMMINLRLPISSRPTDGEARNTISIAQYKVPGKAREELKKAREASAKGKNEEAQKYVAKALEIYPKYADALTLRAILKLDAKDDQGAVADLQQAIDYDGNCAMAYMVMGAVLNTQSKFDEAIRSLQHGEALEPNSWQGHFEMAKALVGKAQYQEALQHLEKAEAFAPTDYPLIHLVKAHAMLALNNYKDAMTELEAYLQKDPQGPNRQQAEKMLDKARAFATNQPSK